MYRLKITSHFDAAHRLKGYVGACSRLHGHRWLVKVTIQGIQLNGLGILVDFKELKMSINEILSEFDHSYLNEHPFFEHTNPTAENIAKYLYTQLSLLTEQFGVSVREVSVYETPECEAVYRE